jgi:hypothetical protein
MNLREAAAVIEQIYLTQIETGVRHSIELESGPGVGKSEVVYQVSQRVAKRIAQPVDFIAEFLSTREQPDVAGFGLPGQDTDGTPIMKRTKAPWAPRLGSSKHGFLFLDEFRQAAHDVQKPAAELLLNGKVGETALDIYWMVLAASNRDSDRSGVNKQMAFIENRRCLLKVEPNLDIWVEDYAEPRGIHPLAIAFAKTKPELVFHDKVPDKQGPFCTPRTLVKVSHLIGKLPMNLFTEVSAGYLGEGTAATFISFLRVAEQLPSFEEIVSKPDTTRVPDRMDAQYATVQMIAHRADGKTAPAAFKYLKRMGKEFQISGLKSTLRRCPQIVATPEFAPWLRENKDLLIAANVLNK